MILTPRDEFKFYHYHPTEAGAVIFAILFAGTTCFHFWQIIRTKCWFMIPLAIGGIFQVIGYGARYKSGTETPDWTLMPYIIQAILLLVAPALYAASVYMELGRIVLMVDGEGHVLIQKKWLTKIFVTGDVLSFLLQAGGGGIQSSGSPNASKTGAKVIIIGLFVQLIFFGFFMIVSIHFHRALSARPTGRSLSGAPWKKFMTVLYVGSMLIMVRSLFRVIEYLQGDSGYILKHEIYLYIFDATLMFIFMVLFSWYHPSEINDILKSAGYSNSYKMDSMSESHLRLDDHV